MDLLWNEMVLGHYNGVLRHFLDEHEHARELWCISQVYSSRTAKFLSYTLLHCCPWACSWNLPIFYEFTQVNILALTSKCYNILILSPISMIYVSIEISFSILSNGISFTPKVQVNTMLWLKNQTSIRRPWTRKISNFYKA